MSAFPDPAADEATLPGLAPLASAAPDLALAAGYAVAWIAPRALSPGVMRILLVSLLLEFIVLHSAAFMGNVAFAPGPRPAAMRRVLGLGVFYTLFVGGFALAFHAAWPLVSFWALTLNRATVVLIGRAPDGAQRRVVSATWGATAMCYLFGVMLTVVLPIPRLGCTPDVVSAMRLPGHGLWVAQPWRAMAFGALYFAAVAAFELFAAPRIAASAATAESAPPARAAA